MALTVKEIASLTSPGRHREGSIKGLFLQITDRGTKSWLLRYERFGRRRWMGLGPLAVVDLKEAQRRAIDARRLLLDGVDPLDARRKQRAAAALEAARTLTFEEAAVQFEQQHAAKWRNAKHAAQFLSTMEHFVFPRIGRLAVADIGTPEVLRVLEQRHAKYPDQRLWDAIPESASRIRGRIDSVLDYATVRGLRPAADNPARWKGHLENVLPPRNRIATPVNHAALPYAAIPTFMAELRTQQGVAPRALEICVLTAARTGEVLGATWDEIDLENATWTIPASRMKAAKEHRVPLAVRAVEILRALPHEKGNPHVFIGPRRAGLSHDAMRKVMQRLGRTEVVHGFRASFRTWASEATAFPHTIMEMALAHAVGGSVERAYARSDLLDQRRKLAEAWSRYCATAPADAKAADDKVVPIRQMAG